MNTKLQTNIYLDPNIKQQAIKILNEYDLGLNDAINIFLKQIILKKKIPFATIQPLAPNKETKNILQEIRQGENLEEITFEQLKAEANKCIAN